MQTLHQTLLNNSDDAQLFALADIWDIPYSNDKDTLTSQLTMTMLDAKNASKVWARLDAKAQGALQLLVSSKGEMNAMQFEPIYGKVRPMGRGQLEREQPHIDPENIMEALYYLGFVYSGFTKKGSGLSPIVFIPSDLIPVLPLHETSYSNLEEDNDELSVTVSSLDEKSLHALEAADTSLVDDMATLLAYLRIHSAGVEEDSFLPVDAERIMPHLLTGGDIRLSFLLGIAVSAGLITTQNGRAHPVRSALPGWLDKPRAQQVQRLADAWRSSQLYHDLWHISGLHPEDGWSTDPTIARGALLDFLGESVPRDTWWSVDDFIQVVKTTDPDFQRPGGDYSSWYIRNDNGDYLSGVESWDAVDGALLEYCLMEPMHWLGLVDTADKACRLTAYGRAFLEMTAWPQPPEPDAKVEIHDDGTLQVSRRVSRLDRFQVARFSTWQSSGESYTYMLDLDGIQQADEQGITTEHISKFINRQLDGAPMPKTIARMLDISQKDESTNTTIETLQVLRTLSPEVMNELYDEPKFRQYLGAKLGDMACVVLNGHAKDIAKALKQMGIETDIR
ncbi:MAG: hypothetical protein ACPG7F_05445 [Aggregatilineales bacterium]